MSDPVWGSRATTVGEGLGGLNGVPLRSGDVLAVPAYDITGRDGKHGAVPAAQQRRYGKALVLRLVPSNQYLQFTAEARRQLFRQVFQVSPQSDRMGVRLDGEALEAPPANMTSEGVALGVVQVPAGGQPIVLMQDRQTIGGYPKIGHVYTVDLDWLAQAVPGTEITFEPGTLEESQALLLQQRELFMSRDSSQFHENGFNGK
ncbi:hypothetical protein MNKW57_10810 [Biformimicrobium ophioploci]|uniref:Carboxyltransferase domain-containing protein n=1 Tax=Biformimicrobium ophioploci TaxID=3036711 RepID=A0ABQ6LXF2_9GAMM|nr:hypothetical protein MNKW57_10810 [Microbulbifer sp. NKW57]